MVFGEAIATTFSLDPTTLLTIPAHLALLGRGNRQDQLENGIMLLEALRRVTTQVTVYAQRGRMQTPERPHVLYGLLESMVVEVLAPRGGVFHPKLWLLRFFDPSGEEPPLLRLIVLSRNLTADRSWDLALTLEGRPGGRYRSENRELGELLASLPDLAKEPMADQERQEQAVRLGDEVRRTKWELPLGFESVWFHMFGRKRRAWNPPASNRMAVISPFCTVEALEMLCQSTGAPMALISRPETLSELSPDIRGRFQQCLVMDEAAETEDGEDQQAVARDTFGLHAKAYIFQKGVNTHLFVGSANATRASLISAENIEILVELIGRRRNVGGIDKLLNNEGLGELLRAFDTPEGPEEVDSSRKAAEEALEKARRTLSDSSMRVRCTPLNHEGGWHMYLLGSSLAPLEGVAGMHAWPLTVSQDHGVDISRLLMGEEAYLGTFSAQSVTGLIAFELTSNLPEVRLRFAMNMPVEGLPPDRDAAILRTVVRNRDGFLKYLLLLLSGFEDVTLFPFSGDGGGKMGYRGRGSSFEDIPLLEELTRVFSREPERLSEVKDVVRRLSESRDGEPIVPPEFLELWHIFEAALEPTHEH
jgi:hypothetical protein